MKRRDFFTFGAGAGVATVFPLAFPSAFGETNSFIPLTPRAEVRLLTTLPEPITNMCVHKDKLILATERGEVYLLNLYENE